MINDKARAVTVEDIIRIYNLEGLKTDRKRISVIKNTLERQYNIIKDFIYFITPYKDQADKVTVWFYDGVPTVKNEPFILFSDADKSYKHLYYDRNTGDIYSLNNNNWALLEDSNLAKSLALANGEPDTSDNKRNIFYLTPITPYEIGDVWINNKVIMRCRCARSAREYKSEDWIIQENYSSDLILKDTKAILDQFIETVEADYVTKVILETTKDSILAKVETTINDIGTLSSELKLQAGQIALKLNASRFTTSAIIGLINNRDGTSTAKIKASNIDLEGTNINLTSQNISISSTNFNVDKDGNTILNNATINGGTINVKKDSQGMAHLIVGTLHAYDEQFEDEYVVIEEPFITGRKGSTYNSWMLGPGQFDIYDADFLFSVNAVGLAYVTNTNEQKFTIYNTSPNGTEPYITPAGMWSAAYNNLSLESKKKNITLDEGCLEQILNTDIVNFNWNYEDDTDKKHIGLIIPDLGGNYKCCEKVMTHDKDAIDLYTMCAMAWKGIQELNKKLEV